MDVMGKIRRKQGRWSKPLYLLYQLILQLMKSQHLDAIVPVVPHCGPTNFRMRCWSPSCLPCLISNSQSDCDSRPSFPCQPFCHNYSFCFSIPGMPDWNGIPSRPSMNVRFIIVDTWGHLGLTCSLANLMYGDFFDRNEKPCRLLPTLKSMNFWTNSLFCQLKHRFPYDLNNSEIFHGGKITSKIFDLLVDSKDSFVGFALSCGWGNPATQPGLSW